VAYTYTQLILQMCGSCNSPQLYLRMWSFLADDSTPLFISIFFVSQSTVIRSVSLEDTCFNLPLISCWR